MGYNSIAIPPARYPSIANEHVIFLCALKSGIIPDTIIGTSPLPPASDLPAPSRG